MVAVRRYFPSDYDALRKLYEDSGWWDEVTDAEKRINNQIEKEPNSILLAYNNEKIIGTVTLLFTGRLGLFFRLVGDTKEIRTLLLQSGEEIFKETGYSETHIIAPDDDIERQKEYTEYGFKLGKNYMWFWKKVQ